MIRVVMLFIDSSRVSSTLSFVIVLAFALPSGPAQASPFAGGVGGKGKGASEIGAARESGSTPHSTNREDIGRTLIGLGILRGLLRNTVGNIARGGPGEGASPRFLRQKRGRARSEPTYAISGTSADRWPV